MHTAARLYAERGFLGASLAQVAAACRASKALIYHYYPSKEDILFDVADYHVQLLVRSCAPIADGPGTPQDKIHRIARTLMELYNGAEANQKVLLNELVHLPEKRRAEVIAHQRQLIDIVDRLICELLPALKKRRADRRVLTMLFFGMLNWTHTWFRPDGKIKADEVATTAADMLIARVETHVP